MINPLDVLAGKTFEKLYSEEIEPNLKRLEVKRQQALQAFALFLVAGLLLVVVEGLLARSISHGQELLPPVGFVVITLLVAGYVGYRPLKNVGTTAQTEIIAGLCRAIGVSYRDSNADAPAFQRFLDLHLLSKSDSQTFQSRFTGERGGRTFTFCEAQLVEGSGSRRHTVFNGLLFQFAFSRSFEGVTVVLREAGLLNRFECPTNLTKVELDNPQFEQVFEVFGSDQIETKALLTPDFMQALLALERAFAGDGLRCAFTDGGVLIALEGHDRFEVGGVFTNLVDRRRVAAPARGLAAVFGLIDSFPA